MLHEDKYFSLSVVTEIFGRVMLKDCSKLTTFVTV